MEIQIIKCHGSGNDFIMIDEINQKLEFSEDQRIKLTKALCNRNSILGADGVLFVLKSSKADAMMRMFNPDGSEAEMCGNGLRCAGRLVTDLLGKVQAQVETMKAVLEVKKVQDIYKDIKTYQVQISPISLELDSLPMKFGNATTVIDETIESLSKDLTFTAVSVPNPHLVTIVEEYDEETFKTIAEKANSDRSLFPNGVNVSFVKQLGNASIFVLTYERGVGFTNACGTAMSASTFVTCLLDINKINSVIDVYNKGGMVQCVVNEDHMGPHSISLIGNATYTFTSTIELDFANPDQFKQLHKKECQDEVAKYAELEAYIKSKFEL
ncbi:MAG TPA: diaminopimelate epimerase [Bacillota bacterium]|nr:diaminopimelate epimerase [Bacillota bacterium]